MNNPYSEGNIGSIYVRNLGARPLFTSQTRKEHPQNFPENFGIVLSSTNLIRDDNATYPPIGDLWIKSSFESDMTALEGLSVKET